MSSSGKIRVGHEVRGRWPAEWECHEATWLSWPREGSLSFPGATREWMLGEFVELIQAIVRFEPVYLNVASGGEENEARNLLGSDVCASVRFCRIETNEPWCRDYGPLVLDDRNGGRRVIVYEFNGWGSVYGELRKDAQAGLLMARELQLPITRLGAFFEGGAADANGEGIILASSTCLLAENRNPELDRVDFARLLANRVGSREIVWCDAQLVGDDTGGHVDGTVRFVDRNRVVAVTTDDADYLSRVELEKQAVMLEGRGRGLEVVRLPLPSLRLVGAPGDSVDEVPASYANFIFVNGAVIVPMFGVPEDERAIDIFEELFPMREVVGLSSERIIWGLGSFHCLTLNLPV